MRDFLPSDVRKRDYVIGVIKDVYERYGFEPLETPSIENLDTLTNKYGEEGNQLMFKILKRGEKLQQELSEGKIRDENQLADLALRYDLTVPLARVVANNRNELPKFFKRYQIQPVWRADRPAKGRYREFYQCDVDSIGSASLMIEAEQIEAVCEVLEKLGFEDFEVRVNHRKVLTGLLEVAGIPEEMHGETLVSIDKLDKIGFSGVLGEFKKKSIPFDEHDPVWDLFHKVMDTASAVSVLKELLEPSQQGTSGADDLWKLFRLLETTTRGKISVDPSLARGLSYYTGAIFEIRVPDLAGSLGGGGRYDGLIGMFGKEEIPACGFSLGLERILVVMEERGMFPGDLPSSPADVMVTVWSDETILESLKLAGELRSEGFRVLVYPQADRLGKQFKYADQINVPLVCVLGESEIAEGTVSLKDMKTGEQKRVQRAEVAAEAGVGSPTVREGVDRQ